MLEFLRELFQGFIHLSVVTPPSGYQPGDASGETSLIKAMNF